MLCCMKALMWFWWFDHDGGGWDTWNWIEGATATGTANTNLETQTCYLFGLKHVSKNSSQLVPRRTQNTRRNSAKLNSCLSKVASSSFSLSTGVLIIPLRVSHPISETGFWWLSDPIHRFLFGWFTVTAWHRSSPQIGCAAQCLSFKCAILSTLCLW